MSKVKDENYIVVQGWMVNQLNLKGNELLIYALIYGFSQDYEQKFTGSLQYIADWTNSTKAGVSKALKKLVEKGLLKKNDVVVNGVKFCEYYATKLDGVCNKVVRGMQQSCTGYATKLDGGMQQSLTNNIDNNTINNIENNIKNNNSVNYQQIVDMYNETCVSFPAVRSLSEARKRAIRARLKSYKLEGIQEAFIKAEDSDFLKGANDRNWSAKFDWIMNDANMAKILDGNYDNKTKQPKKDSMGTSFMDLDF